MKDAICLTPSQITLRNSIIMGGNTIYTYNEDGEPVGTGAIKLDTREETLLVLDSVRFADNWPNDIVVDRVAEYEFGAVEPVSGTCDATGCEVE